MNRLEYLFSPVAIRERCQKVMNFTQKGEGLFNLHLDKLEAVAALVEKITLEKYTDFSQIPFHSRFRHFEVNGVDLTTELYLDLKSNTDLVVVSVLLDAGAGPDWKYRSESGQIFSRSEGLAIASLEMFKHGLFSSDTNNPFQVNADRLQELKISDLESGMQVSGINPLNGLAGRVELLNNLGLRLSELYGQKARAGDLSLNWSESKVAADKVLNDLLVALGPIWPSRFFMEETPLGDVWPHSKLSSIGSFESYIPFHKLTQWLSYSLFEALIRSGKEILGIEKLTGLPEYRNGGLFLDSGVLSLKDPTHLKQEHLPSSELIIEWRALTVILLDQLGNLIRTRQKMSEAELPLVKILEGGTWWAGRSLAAQMRGGKPPLNIQSDGTVF